MPNRSDAYGTSAIAIGIGTAVGTAASGVSAGAIIAGGIAGIALIAIYYAAKYGVCGVCYGRCLNKGAEWASDCASDNSEQLSNALAAVAYNCGKSFESCRARWVPWCSNPDWDNLDCPDIPDDDDDDDGPTPVNQPSKPKSCPQPTPPVLSA